MKAAKIKRQIGLKSKIIESHLCLFSIMQMAGVFGELDTELSKSQRWFEIRNRPVASKIASVLMANNLQNFSIR